MKILAIDIGGTYIKYACMTEDLEMLSKGKVRTPKEGRKELVEAIGMIFDNTPGAEGIAISMAGIIDSEKGHCLMGGALRYNNDFYLQDSLYERCPVDIYIENDAKCAAMAEAASGSLKDVEDGFVLIFGTMIGGAYIKDHKLQKGKHFSSGEVSYIITAEDGDPTVEGVIGNRLNTVQLCQWYAKAKGLPPEEVNGMVVFDAVKQNDPDACRCLDRFAKGVAVMVFNLQTILDVERFAIGGGISEQPVFVESIRRHLDQMYAKSAYNVPRADVTVCQYHNDANLIGAMQCFLANRRS